jgi:hypothetical protein
VIYRDKAYQVHPVARVGGNVDEIPSLLTNPTVSAFWTRALLGMASIRPPSTPPAK